MLKVPPSTGVKTSYWLPLPSVRMAGMVAGLTGASSCGCGGDGRRTLTVMVAEQFSACVSASAW